MRQKRSRSTGQDTNFARVIFTGLTVLEGLELRKNHAPHPHMGQPETAGPHPPYPSANPNPNV